MVYKTERRQRGKRERVGRDARLYGEKLEGNKREVESSEEWITRNERSREERIIGQRDERAEQNSE